MSASLVGSEMCIRDRRAAESAESEPAVVNGRASSQARSAGDRRASGPSAPRAAESDGKESDAAK
eukprot:9813966-Alexandrium_andersonii.AAC.1